MQDNKSHFVKIFGERNSGTRAVTQMVRKVRGIRTCHDRERALEPPAPATELREKIGEYYGGKWRRLYDEALTDCQAQGNPGMARWKHAVAKYDESFADTAASVLFCIRNPYSWTVSFAKRPYHRKGPQAQSFVEFIDRPWMTVGREHAPAVVRSPLSLWNMKYASYAKFKTEATIPNTLIKFENFVVNPVPYLVGKLDELGLPSAGVVSIEKSTKDERSLDDIRSYYLQEKWRGWLTAPVVEAINRQVDWNVALYFGYNPLNPKDFPEKVTPEIEIEMAQWFAEPKLKNLSHNRSLMSRWGFRS